MVKSKKPDIKQMLLKAHRLGIKQAIDTSARTNTALIVYEDGKIKAIKPSFKYVRVPVKAAAKRQVSPPRASKKKK